MARPIVQLSAAVIVFIIIGVASIMVTNALFNVMASSKPSVTFSIVSASPGSQATP